jgi:hypothetical protein
MYALARYIFAVLLAAAEVMWKQCRFQKEIKYI